MSGRPSAPGLVVFDLGSTLVRPSPGGPAQRISDALGLADNERTWLNWQLMTRPFEHPAEVSALIESEFGVTGAADVVDEVWRAQEKEAEPADGALSLVERLIDASVGLALMSNIWRPYRDSVWRWFGPLFDEHVPADLRWLSFEQGTMKPSLEGLRGLLAAARCDPRQAVMVGDSYRTDLAPAMQLGMRTVWVLSQPQREADALVGVLDGALDRPDISCKSMDAAADQLLALLHDGLSRG